MHERWHLRHTFFGLLDLILAGSVNILRLHSLQNKLCGHQPWLLPERSPIRLKDANQGLEMLHILCVHHIVALVVPQHSMLCLIERPRALLMVVKVAAVPADDQEELHNILFGISLCICSGSLELALQVRRALPNDKCVWVLLILLELEYLLLGGSDILLPEVHLSIINITHSRHWRWVFPDCQDWEAQLPDCLCNVRPAFILLLDVVGNGVHRSLALGRVFCVANVKGVTFES
jgi:hypothetical protein